MFVFIRSAAKSLFFALSILSLSACALTSGAGLRGASSMTIDVEVYKGPLSKTIQIQEYELEAQATDVINTLFLIRQKARLQALKNKCKIESLADIKIRPSTPRDNSESGQKQNENNDQEEFENKVEQITELSPECFIVVGIEYDSFDLRNRSSTIIRQLFDSREAKESGANKFSKELSSDSIFSFAQLGARLRTRSDYWATHLATADISNQEVRALVAEFAHSTSEFGNQITSRSDALLLQKQQNLCPSNGAGDRKPCPRYEPGLRIAGLLSTGLYLRDSSTTNFVNLYDWADAIPGRLDGLKFGPSRKERVRTVELLINDTYWSNINSVYASGQGDVSMAFIKDDIGNWNLKSFENDPTELLDAYDEVAISSLRQLAKLTKKVASGGASEGVKGLLELASNSTPIEQAQRGTVNASSLNTLRPKLLENITVREEKYNTAKSTLIGEKNKLETDITIDEYARALIREETQKSLSTIDRQISDEKTNVSDANGCNEEPLSETCQKIENASAEGLCGLANIVRTANLEQLCEKRSTLQDNLNSLDSFAASPENVVKACSQQAMSLETTLAKNCRSYTDMTNALVQLRRDTLADVQRLIADYKAVVNALQLSVAAPE